jgi:hypothetical protein
LHVAVVDDDEARRVALVDELLEVTARCERPDLVERLSATRRRMLDPRVRVVVVGEFKQGKSQLVNALVNAPVCPVDDDVATAVPTVVAHADPPAAFVVVADDEGGGRDPHEPGAPPRERRLPVELDELAEHVSERAVSQAPRRPMRAEVGLPRQLLAGGLVLVDTPGVGGLGSAHAVATLAALPEADAVLMVSDAAQEYSEAEVEFLRHAMKLCPNVACVLTKTDLYPQWRKVADLDRSHLQRAGLELPLLPVSSALRLLAAQERDLELHVESGFADLLQHLRDDVVGQAVVLARRSLVHDVLSVTEQLSLSLEAERQGLRDPARTKALLTELEAARSRADELRKRSARWHQTLSDGTTDLISDIDHDLRDRVRAIGREAEEAIDESDPGQVWEQFTPWLEQRVAAAVADNVVWADERSQWLAGRVAAHFAEGGSAALPRLGEAEPGSALAAVPTVADLDPGELTAGQKVLVGMKGSYGGVLMFGLLTSIAGLALINPISVGAGLLLGSKAYQEDKANRLRRRRTEAKALVRRQLDEVVFYVAKDSKDRLRRVQRAIRDHYTDTAEELHRSLDDSVRATQRAVRTDGAHREERIKELTAQLRRIEGLRERAAAMAPVATPPATPPAAPPSPAAALAG